MTPPSSNRSGALAEAVERARNLAELLERFFPAPDLPLRHRDPFTLLVAVVLSGHSTDAAVNKVTPALFDQAPTPAALAALPLTTLETLIRPCGLAPQKSNYLAALSRLILERHGGQVPRSFEELEALPGVGHKTAGVVLSQAFGLPAFPVDTHIHRSAWRWQLSEGVSVRRTEEDLCSLFPRERWRDLHLQIIYYARVCCPARGHRLERCALCRDFGRPELRLQPDLKPGSGL